LSTEHRCVRQTDPNEARISADDPSLRYSGRIDRTDPLRPYIAWSLSSVAVGFTGTSLTLVLEETVAGTVSYITAVDRLCTLYVRLHNGLYRL
jgi:hypothetical protein